MKNKLFVLVGESGSGKSTIEKEIHRLGLAKKVVSCTTREARSNEIDGEDYWFINGDIFHIYLRQGQFLEHSSYNGWKYGLNKNDVKLDVENHVCVVNPNGLDELTKKLGEENIISIYIKRDDKKRVIGSLQRDNRNDFDFVLSETFRRYNNDKNDFKNVEEKVNYVIDNNGEIEEALEQFAKIMVKEGVKIG